MFFFFGKVGHFIVWMFSEITIESRNQLQKKYSLLLFFFFFSYDTFHLSLNRFFKKKLCPFHRQVAPCSAVLDLQSLVTCQQSTKS